MVRVICLFAISFLMFQNIFAQQYGSFKDSRDGKVYKTVKIGNQVWMAENLNVSKFRNGDLIPEAKNEEDWKAAGENKQPAWCYYDNDMRNGEKYGKLYNWYAVNDSRGLAPKDWQISSSKDWEKLASGLGGIEDNNYKFESDPNISLTMIAGGKMKSSGTRHWKSPNRNATNESGFSALPGGFRSLTGVLYLSFNSIYVFGSWWTSSENDSNSAWYRNLSYGTGALLKNTGLKSIGYSVRCVKN